MVAQKKDPVRRRWGRIGGGVLAEAEQVLVAVGFLEEAGDELAAERLDVGADAVAHADVDAVDHGHAISD